MVPVMELAENPNKPSLINETTSLALSRRLPGNVNMPKKPPPDPPIISPPNLTPGSILKVFL